MSLSGLGVQAPTGTITIVKSDWATDEAGSRFCHYQHVAISAMMQSIGVMRWGGLPKFSWQALGPRHYVTVHSTYNEVLKGWYMKRWERNFIWNPWRFHIPSIWTSANKYIIVRPCVLQKARTVVQACWTHPGSCTWICYI